MKKLFVKLYVLLCLVAGALACVSIYGINLIIFMSTDFPHPQQGHTLKVNYIKMCGDDNVVKIQENSTAKLTSTCEIIPTACGQTPGFKTAMVHYEVFKNNL
jgi:hypothetical protein